MAPRKKHSHQLKAWGIFLGCLVALLIGTAGVLIALGAHSETVDLSPDPASAAEQNRQELAVAAARIAASADLAPADSALQSEAQEWLAALGGVWVPWPDEVPEGYANPTLDQTPYDSPAALDAALWEFSQKALAAQLSGVPEAAPEPESAAATGASTAPKSTPETAPKSASETTAETTPETAPKSASETTAETTPESAPHALQNTIALAAARHAALLDRQLGNTTDCAAYSPAHVAQALAAAPRQLATLETARQWLEFESAHLAAEERSSQQAAITLLTQAIDAGLAQGLPDNRPVMARPPAAGENGFTLARDAVAVLAAAAPNSDAAHAIIAYGCTLDAALPTSALTSDSGE